MEKRTVEVISIATVASIAVFWLGVSLNSCASQPVRKKDCYGSMLRVSKSYTSEECSEGAEALPPEKVIIEGEEQVIVRCVCSQELKKLLKENKVE